MLAVTSGTTRARSLEAVGGSILRYGLVAILLYFGAFKFTAVEAQGIQPLVAHSPFLAWLYQVLSVQGVSNLIGSIEIAIAILIAARPVSAALSAVGSLMASLMLLTTLSFLVTTPRVWLWLSEFPLPVPNEVGAFLLKDVFLPGAAIWTAGEALAAARSPAARTSPAAAQPSNARL